MLFAGMALTGAKRSDAQLENWLEQIATGDKNALGALYESVKDAIYGFALSMVRDSGDAEDILQDTFVNVYASAGSYRRMGKPMAWVFAIARNLSLMKLRDRGKTTGLSDEEWSLFAHGDSGITSDERLTLMEAMNGLSPEESRIVMLRAVAGLKHREIAKLLGAPLSTVLSRYNRAIKKLRATLREVDAHA